MVGRASGTPRKWNPDISPKLESIVLECLAKDPADRYGSALDLLNDLVVVYGENPVNVHAPDASVAVKPKKIQLFGPKQ